RGWRWWVWSRADLRCCGGSGRGSPGCGPASPSWPSGRWRGGYGRDRARRQDREPARDARAPRGRVREARQPLQVGGRGPQGRSRRERQEHHGRDDARGGVWIVPDHQDRRRGCGIGDGRAARPRRRRLPRDASDGRAARGGAARRGAAGKRGARVSDRQLKGIGVSPGIGVGAAIVVRWTMPEVPDRVVPRSQVEKEVRRLRAAVKDVKRYLQDLRAKAEDRAGVDEARIFDAQILMLEDKEFLSGVAGLIRENHLAAEKAYEFKALEVRDMWTATGSSRLKDRLADLSGVTVRVSEHLMHRGSDELWEDISQPSVVVAKELSPGLTVPLDREHVVGLVSEEGTRTSHAAILAHSIGIPAVFGVAGAIERIEPGTMVVMDGERGTVLLQPTPHEIAEAQERELGRRELGLQLEEVVDQPSVTTDGVRVVLRGNVDLPDEIKPAQDHRAEGVGLLRTEFLITGHDELPTEDEQADYFRRVAQAFPGHPVVVRTYDLGGDKLPAPFRAPSEINPQLGWRAIRVCLDRPDIFRTQVRAALRAAKHGDVWMMIPLVTRLDELQRTRAIVTEE